MQTIILGLDAFDPAMFERLANQGRMPNLTRYVEAGAYSRLRVPDPPQSEVSWTSIATGLNPGDHGIFDFVHRDPENYAPYVSLLPTERKWGATRFRAPSTARTLFDQAVTQGYPASTLWWPATFPAQQGSPVRTIPGLGTPDVQGKLGVGTLYSDDRALGSELDKVAFRALEPAGRLRFRGRLEGPASKKGGSSQPASLDFVLELKDGKDAELSVGTLRVALREGEWSPIVELQFRMGWAFTFHALAQAILVQRRPSVRLYFLPLQLHPLHSPWPYATPGDFVRETWRQAGPFLTVGWPQDTTGLEEGCITDDQFLELCGSIQTTRERAFLHHVEKFQEGVLAVVLDSLDRVQHMFWRDRPDVIEGWYERLDAFVGKVELERKKAGGGSGQFLVLSDHGFTDFGFKVHLNRWLIDHGYMRPGDQGSVDGPGGLRAISWPQTQAYALGLNSVYLNLRGREREGCVDRERQEVLLQELKRSLEAWRGPDGRPVVARAMPRAEALEGSLADYGPDLIVGYSPGYRASAETGLSQWGAAPIVPNRDHWGADHCILAESVPGVLFAQHGIGDVRQPSYRDIPWLAIGRSPEQRTTAVPLPTPEEDMETVEERLRGLGYL